MSVHSMYPAVNKDGKESSNLNSVKWSDVAHELEIVFKRPDKDGKTPVYVYEGFLQADWDAMTDAESIGSWYLKNVPRKFTCRKYIDNKLVSRQEVGRKDGPPTDEQ